MSNEQQREVATLAGGCFWCLEAAFAALRGVFSVKSGYAGGKTANPTYQEVCTGRTGHAEVVQTEFDPAVIGFEDLLDVFFTIHDPTTLNRQGADVGTQYRSAIFHHDDEQKRKAEEKIAQLTAAKVHDDPIVTQVAPLTEGEHVVEAILAEPEECRLLQIERGEPCLLIRRRTWSGRQPVTAARLIHPGSRHRLEGRFSK